jgi:DNA-binding NarL/FixJ family response regulator
VAIAANVEEADRALATTPVDVVLLDAGAGVEQAARELAELAGRHPDLQVVPFGLDRETAVAGLVAAGAMGYLLRPATLEDLVETLCGVAAGEPPCSLAVAAQVAQRIARLPGESRRAEVSGRLTLRQLEVLLLVASGLGNKEIAARLNLRTATVKNHLHGILVRMRVRGRREAVRRAFELGLLTAPLRWGLNEAAGPLV